MGNVVYGVAKVLDSILSIYFWVVVVSALITWVRPDPYNPIVRFLRSATEPVYRLFRRVLGRWLIVGGMDLTPIVVILLIEFLKYAVVANLYDWAGSLGRTAF